MTKVTGMMHVDTKSNDDTETCDVNSGKNLRTSTNTDSRANTGVETYANTKLITDTVTGEPSDIDTDSETCHKDPDNITSKVSRVTDVTGSRQNVLTHSLHMLKSKQYP